MADEEPNMPSPYHGHVILRPESALRYRKEDPKGKRRLNSGVFWGNCWGSTMGQKIINMDGNHILQSILVLINQTNNQESNTPLINRLQYLSTDEGYKNNTLFFFLSFKDKQVFQHYILSDFLSDNTSSQYVFH